MKCELLLISSYYHELHNLIVLVLTYCVETEKEMNQRGRATRSVAGIMKQRGRATRSVAGIMTQRGQATGSVAGYVYLRGRATRSVAG